MNVAFTLCIADKVGLFSDGKIVSAFVVLLTASLKKHDCVAPIYCFMPDHLHVIISGRDETSRAKEAMDEFKYASGLWLVKNRPGIDWQGNYHDHIIRASDDWKFEIAPG